jgi:hypothetical protein
MKLRQLQQRIGHLKQIMFRFEPAKNKHGIQERKQLAAAIIEYGRMRQEHYGSHSVLLGAGEVAMRLRETTHTIVKALGVLRDQGRAEETGAHGRWRLRFTEPTEQAPDRALRELPSAYEPGR